MDTIEGGKWLPHQALAWRLCETAVERVRELENEVGCFFDRNEDGSLHGKAFAGQTFRSHCAQGRSDRHRDHQPPDGTGMGKAGKAVGRAPGHCTDPR